MEHRYFSCLIFGAEDGLLRSVFKKSFKNYGDQFLSRQRFGLSVCLSVSLSVCLSLSHSLTLSLCVCVCVCLFVCVFVCVFDYCQPFLNFRDLGPTLLRIETRVYLIFYFCTTYGEPYCRVICICK